MMLSAHVCSAGPQVGESVDPTKIPGLVAWYDARYLNLADGALVGLWPDLSGNGFDLTQSTTARKPSFKVTGTVAGVPAVSFDTVDDFITTGNVFGTDFMSPDITIITEYGGAAIPTNAIMAYLTPNETPWTEWVQYWTSSTVLSSRIRDASATIVANLTPSTAGVHIGATRVHDDPSAPTVESIEGGQSTMSTGSSAIKRSSANNDGFRLGNSSGGGVPELYSCAIYKRQLTNAELAYLGVQLP